MKITLTKALIHYKGKYLFLQKVNDMLPQNNGKWECAGGKIKPKEKPEQQVLEEVHQETGLKCKITKQLPFISMKDNKYDSNCYCFLLEAPTNKVTLSKEHSKYKWVKPNKVNKLNLVLFANLLLEYFNNEEYYLKQP